MVILRGRFPIQCLPPNRHSLPHYQNAPTGWTFFTIDKHTLTYHHHLKSIIYIMVHQGIKHSMSFAALKLLCSAHHASLPLLAPDNYYLYCLYSFAFSKMSYTWNHTVHGLSRLECQNSRICDQLSTILEKYSVIIISNIFF